MNNLPVEPEATTRVVPLRPAAKAALDPRLEEIRLLLLETEAPSVDEALSDAQVIQDGYAFQQRFGIGFNWPRQDRVALLRLMHEKGLNDAEVKLFRRTGNLVRTPLGVSLTASAWVAWIGAALLSFWTGIFGTLTVLYLLHWRAVSFSAYRAAALAGITLLLGCVTYWLHFKPWLIQRRSSQSR